MSETVENAIARTPPSLRTVLAILGVVLTAAAGLIAFFFSVYANADARAEVAHQEEVRSAIDAQDKRIDAIERSHAQLRTEINWIHRKVDRIADEVLDRHLPREWPSADDFKSSE